MTTKEEYYALILESRALAKDPEVLKCTCPHTQCEWHGRCKICVALHRHYGDHLPACLQPLINDKLKQLVQVGEMEAVPKKDTTPIEFVEYVRERDKS